MAENSHNQTGDRSSAAPRPFSNTGFYFHHNLLQVNVMSMLSNDPIFSSNDLIFPSPSRQHIIRSHFTNPSCSVDHIPLHLNEYRDIIKTELIVDVHLNTSWKCYVI